MTLSRDHARSITAVTSGQSHTPGPWTVGREGCYPVVRKVFHEGHHMNVCGPVHGYMYSQDEGAEQAANAHLIAAAPVLLEAVCEALGVLEIAEAYGLYEPGSLGEVDVRDCRQQLRRAHHDATGRWMTPVEAELGGSEDLFATEYAISKATGAGQ